MLLGQELAISVVGEAADGLQAVSLTEALHSADTLVTGIVSREGG